METALLVVLGVVAPGIGALLVWRVLDHRVDNSEIKRLLVTQPKNPRLFNREMLRDLPEPVQRFLSFAIAQGTPLYTLARIEMQGSFSLGTKTAPNYMQMRATQVLAAPTGFVWKMACGSGVMRMSGSDAGAWTRSWLAGLLPVARLGGTPDHKRSAFGRYVAEAAFWTPAALLPDNDVTWEAIAKDTARYEMARGGLVQSVYVTVDADGRPTRVEFQRWSNANPEGIYQWQLFGGFLSEFRDVQGFCVPTHVEAGNFFGTDDYFPFFIADVTQIEFPAS